MYILYVENEEKIYLGALALGKLTKQSRILTAKEADHVTNQQNDKSMQATHKNPNK